MYRQQAYQCDLLTLLRLQLLDEYGNTCQALSRRLIETNYATRKYRDPAALLRRNAEAAWSYSKSLGFNQDPLNPNEKRTGIRMYQLGSKLYAPKPKRIEEPPYEGRIAVFPVFRMPPGVFCRQDQDQEKGRLPAKETFDQANA